MDNYTILKLQDGAALVMEPHWNKYWVFKNSDPIYIVDAVHRVKINILSYRASDIKIDQLILEHNYEIFHENISEGQLLTILPELLDA